MAVIWLLPLGERAPDLQGLTNEMRERWRYMSIASDDTNFAAHGANIHHRIGNLEIRLAETQEDIRACQRLRYEVFYEEMAAKPLGDMAAKRLDYDKFDAVADHLMVLDRSAPEASNDDPVSRGKVIGTYRLIRRDVADAHGGFYTSGEYDIAPMLKRAGPGVNFLELGRSCVHREHRNRPTINMLWHGIGQYIAAYDIDVMFGCASFPGVDPKALAQPLSFLHHTLQTPKNFHVRALPDQYAEMNLLPAEDINERAALRQMPPLIRGYMRAGCVFGEGAVIDPQFSTVDVFVMLVIKNVEERYFNRFGSED
jgi:L-ornithine Nalpha-acyltransferase